MEVYHLRLRILLTVFFIGILSSCSSGQKNTYSTIDEAFEHSGIEAKGIIKQVNVNEASVLFYQGMHENIGIGLVRNAKDDYWYWVMGSGMVAKASEPVTFSWSNLDMMNKPGDGYHVHWGSLNNNKIARLHVSYIDKSPGLDHDAEILDTGLGYSIWYVILDKYTGPIPGVKAVAYSRDGEVLYSN
jgi:hypothetical protein